MVCGLLVQTSVCSVHASLGSTPSAATIDRRADRQAVCRKRAGHDDLVAEGVAGRHDRFGERGHLGPQGDLRGLAERLDPDVPGRQG
jgi:hypothetical protein